MSTYLLVAGTALALLWTAILARLVARHRRWNRFDALLVVFAAGATVDTLSAGGLVAAPLAHSVLIASSLIGLLLCVELVGLVTATELPGRWWWRGVTVLLVATLLGAVVLGAPEGPIATAQWASSTARLAYWMGYGIVQVGSCSVIFVRLLRFVPALAPGPLRQVTLMLTVAAGFGALWGITLWVLALDGVGLNSGIGEVAYVWGSVNYVFLAAAYLRFRLTRRNPSEAQLIALEPLWRRLHDVDPAVSLAGWPQAGLSGPQLAMAGVRVVVEIRDWLHLLAQRLPAHADAMAAAREELPGAPEAEVEAVATAAWIRVALARPPGEASARTALAPRSGRDLDEELRLLIAVAQAPDEVAVRVADRLRAQIAASVP